MINEKENRWNGIGAELGRQGKYEEAIQAYNKAIELNPQFLEAWCNKSAILVKQGKFDEAIYALDMAIEINPRYAVAWITKSFALLKVGKFDEAIMASDKAIEINPHDGSIWNLKGLALGRQSKYDESIKAYEKAIEINPQYSKAWYNKASALIHIDRFDEAIKACNKAIEIDPQFADAKAVRKGLLEKVGNSLDFDLCPVCKTGRLSITYKKMLLGAITHHDVICNNPGCKLKMNDQQVKDFIKAWEDQRNFATGIWLNGIIHGRGFPVDNNPPILLKKNEEAIITMHNVSLSENKSIRTGSFVSGRVKVAKGASIGGGTFQSQSHDELATLDTGTLTLTNRRIVFVGKTHSLDILLNKIISIKPYSNALVVGIEGRANAKQFSGINESNLKIEANGRTWKIPIDGRIMQAMVEKMTHQPTIMGLSNSPDH